MTQALWEELSFFEQLSNIDGDVERLISSHERYLLGQTKKDNSSFYLDNILKLIEMTKMDSKNSNRSYFSVELLDEVEEIKRYLNNECSAEYIRRYWNAYTNAISRT